MAEDTTPDTTAADATSSPLPSAALATREYVSDDDEPRSFFGRLMRAAKQTTIAERVQAQVKKAEVRVLSELRERINNLDGDATAAPKQAAAVSGPDAATAPQSRERSRGPRKPSALMAELLSRAQDQTREQAQDALLVATLKLLTPDEARMLAALSDGSVFAVIHVLQAPLIGVSQMVLENASGLGRAAGVSLPEHTPIYLTRLKLLGLLDLGPEDASLQTKYEMLMTDSGVQEAQKLIEVQRKSSAKIQRRSVQISALGKQLWEFSHRPFTVRGSGSGLIKA
jgi:hypothetical protein